MFNTFDYRPSKVDLVTGKTHKRYNFHCLPDPSRTKVLYSATLNYLLVRKKLSTKRPKQKHFHQFSMHEIAHKGEKAYLMSERLKP